MPNIFFTSDTHFHHKNIVRGCTEWKDAGQRVRDFDTLEEHDARLVDNINAVVKKGDLLYHLGDWSFGGIEQIWEFRKRINCNQIRLVLGNHDHHIANNKHLQFPHLTENYVRSIDFLGNGQMSCMARELFISIDQFIMNKKIAGQAMCLSHFSQRVWDKAHHGNWNLFGHSHGTIPDYSQFTYYNETTPPGFVERKFKCMDVGVDTHPEFRPYHFDEIAAIMKDRINLRVDHHNENTN